MFWPCWLKIICEGRKHLAAAAVGAAIGVAVNCSQSSPGIAVDALVGVVTDVAASLPVCRLASPISGLVRTIVPRAKIRVLWFKRSKAKRDLSKREL